MIIASKMLTEKELMTIVKRIHANHRFQYLLLERYSDIELDFYNDNFNLKHCYRGRFFGEKTEIQFRLKGQKYIALLISDETEIEGSGDFEQVCGLEHYKKRPQSVYLWGSILDDKTWYQQRIPKLLNYPIKQPNKDLINVKLKVTEYHRNGVVEFVRFQGFEQKDTGK
jgi:hypothetical protein